MASFFPYLIGIHFTKGLHNLKFRKIPVVPVRILVGQPNQNCAHATAARRSKYVQTVIWSCHENQNWSSAYFHKISVMSSQNRVNNQKLIFHNITDVTRGCGQCRVYEKTIIKRLLECADSIFLHNKKPVVSRGLTQTWPEWLICLTWYPDLLIGWT